MDNFNFAMIQNLLSLSRFDYYRRLHSHFDEIWKITKFYICKFLWPPLNINKMALDASIVLLPLKTGSILNFDKIWKLKNVS